MDGEINTIRQKIKRELADFLGTGMEDIEDESDFVTDFHMGPTEIADFMDVLNKSGLETENVDLTQIETFSDLVESLSQ